MDLKHLKEKKGKKIRKVKHEGSGKYGYKDAKNNIWIPSGENGYGGPHWDVQKPNGGYVNILPGGKIR